jgi:hypothetical protein
MVHGGCMSASSRPASVARSPSRAQPLARTQLQIIYPAGAGPAADVPALLDSGGIAARPAGYLRWQGDRWGCGEPGPGSRHLSSSSCARALRRQKRSGGRIGDEIGVKWGTAASVTSVMSVVFSPADLPPFFLYSLHPRHFQDSESGRGTGGKSKTTDITDLTDRPGHWSSPRSAG